MYADFKPQAIAAASGGFPAIAWLVSFSFSGLMLLVG